MIADKVLKSNVIYTGVSNEIISGGVAVSGNRIIAVAGDDEIDGYIGKDTEVYEYRVQADNAGDHRQSCTCHYGRNDA